MGMGFKSGTGLLTPKHPVNVLIHVYPSISGNSIGLDQSPIKFSQLPWSNSNHPTCGHHVPKVGPWYLLAKSKKSNWRSLQDPLIIWLCFQQYPCTEKKNIFYQEGHRQVQRLSGNPVTRLVRSSPTNSERCSSGLLSWLGPPGQMIVNPKKDMEQLKIATI